MDNQNKTQNEQDENKNKTDQPTPTDKPAEIVPAAEAPTNEDTRALAEREPSFMMDEEQMMDHTIEISEKLEKYEKALNMVINFIIKRCYPGDFVSHDSKDKPLEERTANINNAAAERIARDLGIRETERTDLKKETDKEGHYTYTCSGVFTFRGQRVSAIGQATTRNPFHSKAYGKQKPVGEIREDYIRTECLHDLTKQGVKKIFGLRKIPLTKLQELGYDIAKVRVVSFDAKEGSQADKNKAATQSPPSEKWITLVSQEDKKFKDRTFTIFKTSGGNEVSCWHTGEALKTLKASVGNAQVKVVMFQKGKYWNIDKVMEVGAI